MPPPKGGDPHPAEPTRRETIQKNGGEIHMPPLAWGDHLVGYLFELGPTMASGMGGVPLTFSEIESWQRLACIELHPWEVRLLRRLSSEYLAESHKATKPDCPPPYGASPIVKKIRARDAERNLDAFLA